MKKHIYNDYEELQYFAGAYVKHSDVFGLIGISPFNSYFSQENIQKLCEMAKRNFRDFALFIPDEISKFTLEACGYDASRIKVKIRKQENYLHNKCVKALDAVGKSASDSLIYLSDLRNSQSYQEKYSLYTDLFQTDDSFKNGCINTSSWVLSSYGLRAEETSAQAVETSVQYLLHEMPIFLCADEVINVDRTVFVYHNFPNFLQNLAQEFNLLSPNQSLYSCNL